MADMPSTLRQRLPMNFTAIGFIVFASVVISFVSGRFSWGFVAPILGGFLFFFSDNPVRNFGMAAGVFMMASIPLGIMGLLGASIGYALSPWKKNGKGKASEPEHR